MATASVKTLAAALLCAVALNAPSQAQTASAPAQMAGPIDRSVLPILEPNTPVYTELDARNAKPPVPFRLTAPQGAPNERRQAVVAGALAHGVASARAEDRYRECMRGSRYDEDCARQRYYDEQEARRKGRRTAVAVGIVNCRSDRGREVSPAGTTASAAMKRWRPARPDDIPSGRVACFC